VCDTFPGEQKIQSPFCLHFKYQTEASIYFCGMRYFQSQCKQSHFSFLSARPLEMADPYFAGQTITRDASTGIKQQKGCVYVFSGHPWGAFSGCKFEGDSRASIDDGPSITGLKASSAAAE